MINIPKGTKDVLPSESYKWHFLENKAREVAKLYNLREIRTPVFEHTELFLRGVGKTTDIVNKEMYTFLDKGDRSITLKPEGTAGVARSFIENGMQSDLLPQKMYYFTPVFRYERPQNGRLREHHQFGIEIYGGNDADIDAEVILTAYTFLQKVGVKELELYINSIGCKECRPKFNEALKEYLRPHLSEMCPTCRDRFDKNPLRILDCKEEACSKINANAPIILDYLCDECRLHFEKLKKLLTSCGLSFNINPTIVRGLDYYSKTVFEFVSTALGAKSTVCGGGRYDGLVEEIGGSHMPAVGFGLGLERLLILMDNLKIEIPMEEKLDLYIATIGEKAYDFGFKLLYDLRQDGLKAEIDHMGRSFKAQMKYSNKVGARYVIVIGDDEVLTNRCKLKNMENGEEREIDFSAIKENI